MPARERFEVLRDRFYDLKDRHEEGGVPLEGFGVLTADCLELLNAAATYRELASLTDKRYMTFEGDGNLSRPIRESLFITTPDSFQATWDDVIGSVDSERCRLVHLDLEPAIYTATMAFAAGIDLYRRGARKTPGTYFEVLIASLFRAITGLPQGKFVDLPESDHKVTTDLVLKTPDAVREVAVPTKITTRERINQPFVHQRILDSATEGGFRSVLVCVSETQRDGPDGVKEICVPGQVDLYQRHVASLDALYYLDPPETYRTADFTEILPVKTFPELFGDELAIMVGQG